MPKTEAPRHSWRRMARVAAMQTLCEVDSTGHDLDEILNEKRLSRPLSDGADGFLTALSAGALANAAEIDRIITRHARGWRISQMAMVDRNLLRMAIYEIAFWRQAPPSVAINEAVEIAKAFGSESSPRFINGVLGAVARANPEPAQPTFVRGNPGKRTRPSPP